MSRIFFITWYPKEWLSDSAVSALSPASRAAWHDWLNHMALKEQCGELIGTVESLARLGRVSIEQAKTALKELEETGTADVQAEGELWIVRNRRMFRAAQAFARGEAPLSGAERARRFRARHRQEKLESQSPTVTERNENGEIVTQVTETVTPANQLAEPQNDGGVTENNENGRCVTGVKFYLPSLRAAAERFASEVCNINSATFEQLLEVAGNLETVTPCLEAIANRRDKGRPVEDWVAYVRALLRNGITATPGGLTLEGWERNRAREAELDQAREAELDASRHAEAKRKAKWEAERPEREAAQAKANQVREDRARARFEQGKADFRALPPELQQEAIKSAKIPEAAREQVAAWLADTSKPLEETNLRAAMANAVLLGLSTKRRAQAGAAA